MRSIGAHAGLEFTRIRIGIGRPTEAGEPSWDPEIVSGWVLGKPDREDKEPLEEAVRGAADAIEVIITDGVDSAGNRFNQR